MFFTTTIIFITILITITIIIITITITVTTIIITIIVTVNIIIIVIVIAIKQKFRNALPKLAFAGPIDHTTRQGLLTGNPAAITGCDLYEARLCSTM